MKVCAFLRTICYYIVLDLRLLLILIVTQIINMQHFFFFWGGGEMSKMKSKCTQIIQFAHIYHCKHSIGALLIDRLE